MAEYHLRRSEKAITDHQELAEIIKGQKYMTLALCHENEPYLVAMNYGFDEAESCLYFHCANEGKKVDILHQNPLVWGQIMEDCGYLPGKCDHAYQSVEFKGTVTFLISRETKRHALELMIDQLEPDPETVKQRFQKVDAFDNTTVGKIHIETMSGKRNSAT